jgi:hypothetical protein
MVSPEAKARVVERFLAGDSPSMAARKAKVGKYTARLALWEAGLLAERPVEAPSRRPASMAPAPTAAPIRAQPAPVPATPFRPTHGDLPAPVRWWGQACDRCGRFTCGHGAAA